jgi:hypothetical protein
MKKLKIKNWASYIQDGNQWKLYVEKAKFPKIEVVAPPRKKKKKKKNKKKKKIVEEEEGSLVDRLHFWGAILRCLLILFRLFFRQIRWKSDILETRRLRETGSSDVRETVLISEPEALEQC